MDFPWTRERSTPRKSLPLTFPNHSRSFDQAHGNVSFWGYASTIEVRFQIGGDMLQRLAPGTTEDEASLLRAFDSHRGAIEKTARNVYARSRQTYCRLTQADF